MRKFLLSVTIILLSLLSPVSVFAHAAVTPNAANIAQYQTFTIGVPTEKEIPTVMVKILIPDGVTGITPNVKPGWKITEKKTGEGETAVVTEIVWSGGVIPAEQRDEFYFRGKTPSSATTLVWKVYQTYQDGSVVSWDQTDNSAEESEDKGPASETVVVNDLMKASPTPIPGVTEGTASTSNILSIVTMFIVLGIGYKVFFTNKN